MIRWLNSRAGLLYLKCPHWSWCRNAHLGVCAPIREPGVVLKIRPSVKTAPSLLKTFSWSSCLGCVITKLLMHPWPGLQVRARAAPGAPAVLRGRHVCAERLGEHRPAHLCPLQPGESLPWHPALLGPCRSWELTQPWDGLAGKGIEDYPDPIPFHNTSLLEALSSLALNIPGVGHPQLPQALTTLSGRNSFPISDLNLFSFNLKSFLFILSLHNLICNEVFQVLGISQYLI